MSYALADLERNVTTDSGFANDQVQRFSWHDVTITVKDRKTKQPMQLLENVSGYLQAGELMALMGPSGCGKTTLLNILAGRASAASSGTIVKGEVLVDGSNLPSQTFRKISSYVEQEDALIGSLTTRETVEFAARLSFTTSMGKKERQEKVKSILGAFGLVNQANTLIGTPLRKGISGGQKRRVSVASQLITGPKILFLDEPTSGLDSVASFEVMSFLKAFAAKYKLLVIASIHQPSSTTFNLFDRILLLSQGKTCYFGDCQKLKPYFDSLGFEMPLQMNPAEFVLDLVNVDFQREVGQNNIAKIQQEWAEQQHHAQTRYIDPALGGKELAIETKKGPSNISVILTLLHRSFIKSYRDVVAYFIRVLMYTGLAIMMGTVWLRLKPSQEYIQPYINAIFFGSAFMSFMAVAYVPAYLEDRATFVKDRANGLYGPTAFLVSNFLVGLPYLFLITVVFSVIAYWLSNFEPSATAFFRWIMWIFLDLVAAESLVVFVSSVFPIFVVSLALVAFANGLWMSVGGFLVSPTILNVFWKYVFHYIDYQSYVFQGMMVNEFTGRIYTCGDSCQCSYQTELAPQCKIAGIGVLQSYGYAVDKEGEWVGILIAIIVVYRMLGWLALRFRN